MSIEPFAPPVGPFYLKSFTVELANNFPPTPSMVVDAENPYLDPDGNPTKDRITDIYGDQEYPAPTEDDPRATATRSVVIDRHRNEQNLVQDTRTLKDGTVIPKMNYGAANVRISICDSTGKVVQVIRKDQTALSDDTVMGLVSLSSAQVADWLADMGLAGVWAG